MTKLEEKIIELGYNNSSTTQSSPYKIDALYDYTINLASFNLNFDSMGEIVVIINGKTIKINKQTLEQLLLTLGVEVLGMTKLEEKLIELGYEQDIQNQFIYIKYKYKNWCHIYAGLNENKTDYYLYLDDIEPICEQRELDSLQQAFNEMQKDLEVLKNVESN